MYRHGRDHQDDVLSTVATMVSQQSNWYEFCEQVVEQLQAQACCFVFFPFSNSPPVLKPCGLWPYLVPEYSVDYVDLWQQQDFYQIRSNKEGAYLTVPIYRQQLTGLLLLQYSAPPKLGKSWRSLADMLANYGALLWQERVRGLGDFMLIEPLNNLEQESVANGVQNRLAALFQHAPIPINGFTPQGQCIFWNLECERILGWSFKELKEHANPARLLYPDKKNQQQFSASMTVEKSSVFTEWSPLTRDGRYLTMLWANIMLPNGNRLCIGHDISQQRALENQQRLIASVFESSYDGIMITDAEHCITHVNPAFTRITGYSADQVLGKYPYLLKYPVAEDEFYEKLSEHLQYKDYWHGEVLSHRKNGQPYSLLLAVSVVKNKRNEVLNHIIILSDISYLKHYEAELRHLAFHDALTGIPNRLLFAELLDQAIAGAKRNHEQLAVCYLDLDGFKAVNDNWGHGAGDQLLMEISQRLSAITRNSDALSRWGGDEFALLITGLSHGQECEEVLLRIQETICQPVLLKGEPVQISASIGVALYPQDAQEAEQLIHCADQAMYQAKRQGKKQYIFFGAGHTKP